LLIKQLLLIVSTETSGLVALTKHEYEYTEKQDEDLPSGDEEAPSNRSASNQDPERWVFLGGNKGRQSNEEASSGQYDRSTLLYQPQTKGLKTKIAATQLRVPLKSGNVLCCEGGNREDYNRAALQHAQYPTKTQECQTII
tara:strand:+ start:1484 stop:1906 length:423 start_codon:yes stop_codon:yes gene_type:complete